MTPGKITENVFLSLSDQFLRDLVIIKHDFRMIVTNQLQLDIMIRIIFKASTPAKSGSKEYFPVSVSTVSIPRKVS